MTALGWILAFVAVQRLGELVLAECNTRRLKTLGAREVGAAHYPLFVVLHASWLASLAVFVPWHTQPNWWLIGLFALLQLARVWIVATLGRYWTTRIITLDTAPVVTGGPFHFVRHPNYLVVCCEIAVLPLAFGAWWIALVWSALNAALLWHRIRVEDAALSARRARPAPPCGERTVPAPAPPP
ncbi:MAG: hypothetical protein IT548_05650 [Alphaproteobacteria bacterium]|nr:hypothetical protein [Alphaproteobacteria bacterium]